MTNETIRNMRDLNRIIAITFAASLLLAVYYGGSCRKHKGCKGECLILKNK